MLRAGLAHGFCGRRGRRRRAGLDHARNNPYDVLVLDLMPPKLDGSELARAPQWQARAPARAGADGARSLRTASPGSTPAPTTTWSSPSRSKNSGAHPCAGAAALEGRSQSLRVALVLGSPRAALAWRAARPRRAVRVIQYPVLRKGQHRHARGNRTTSTASTSRLRATRSTRPSASCDRSSAGGQGSDPYAARAGLRAGQPPS